MPVSKVLQAAMKKAVQKRATKKKAVSPSAYGFVPSAERYAKANLKKRSAKNTAITMGTLGVTGGAVVGAALEKKRRKKRANK